jgi:hypothetical protein
MVSENDLSHEADALQQPPLRKENKSLMWKYCFIISFILNVVIYSIFGILFLLLGRVCKLTMDPRHSSIRLFRKAASELLCKHALVLLSFGFIERNEGYFGVAFAFPFLTMPFSFFVFPPLAIINYIESLAPLVEKRP